MWCYLFTMTNDTTAQPANEIPNILIAPTHADQPGFCDWLDAVEAQVPDMTPVYLCAHEDDDRDDDQYGITRDGDDCSEFDGEPEPREDNFRDDVDADADALAGAGYGTDEDYGYYGGDDY